MKWRNSKERELIAQGGCREQTLPTKSNPNPDLSDPQSPVNKPQNHHLEAMAKTRLAFNETLWTLPPPQQAMHSLNNSANNNNEVEEDDLEEDEEDMDDDEEINVTWAII